MSDLSNTSVLKINDDKVVIEELKAQIFQLKEVINNFPGSIYWKNKDGIYLGRNLYAAKKMYSVELETTTIPEDVIGKSDFDLFPEDIAIQYQKNDLEVMTNGKEISMEEVITLPSGQTLIQLSTKTPLRNEFNEIIGIIGNTVDITDLRLSQKREEEALIKKAKTEEETRQAVMILAGSIAHDLRTPLASIQAIAGGIFKHFLL